MKNNLTTWVNDARWIYDPDNPFTAADNGNSFQITGGTGFEAGYYQIQNALTGYDTGTVDGAQNMVYLDRRSLVSPTESRTTGGQGDFFTPAYGIICDGNSLTAGLGSSGTVAGNNDYPSQLARLMGANYQVANLGIPNQTTASMLADFNTQVLPLLDDNPTVIVAAWEITNDLYYGATAQEAYDRYVQYCTLCRDAGAKVIVISVLPRSNSGTPADFEPNRQLINGWMRADYADYADAIADVAADARIGDAGDEADTTYYNNDLCHLVNAGYEIVANTVAAAIPSALDSTAPALQSAVLAADGTTLTLTFTESVTGNTGISVKVAGANRTFTIAGSDTTRTLTLSSAAYQGQSVTVSYAAGDIADAASNDLEAFTDVAVTNNSTVPLPDTTAPALQSAAIITNGTTLTLTFSESVTGVSAADYSLSNGATLSNVSGSGATRTLTITPTVYASQTPTLSYTGTATKDGANNLLATFSGCAVTNNSTVAAPESDTTPANVPVLSEPIAQNESVLLFATAPSDTDTAYVRFYRNGTAIKTVSATPSRFVTYADTGLTNGVSYSYQVSSLDESGNESALSTAQSTIPHEIIDLSVSLQSITVQVDNFTITLEFSGSVEPTIGFNVIIEGLSRGFTMNGNGMIFNLVLSSGLPEPPLTNSYVTGNIKDSSGNVKATFAGNINIDIP